MATGKPTPDELAKKVSAGYQFDGPSLDLGALVVAGAARPDAPIRIPLEMLNRHGLVAGATGTGKTKTLQLIAEQLSALGVPVFLADIKGDVSGMAAPGEPNDKILSRTLRLSVTSGTPSDAAAQGLIIDTYVTKLAEEIETWSHHLPTQPEDWQEATLFARSLPWLTVEEAEDIGKDLLDVVDEHRKPRRTAQKHPKGSRPVRAFVAMFPLVERATAEAEDG